MTLREHMLDQHGWTEEAEGFASMDEAALRDSHRADHGEDGYTHPGAYPQTPEEAVTCHHNNKVWFGHECGLCEDEYPDHADDVIYAQWNTCTKCGELLVTTVGDSNPVCATHG